LTGIRGRTYDLFPSPEGKKISKAPKLMSKTRTEKEEVPMGDVSQVPLKPELGHVKRDLRSKGRGNLTQEGPGSSFKNEKKQGDKTALKYNQ